MKPKLDLREMERRLQELYEEADKPFSFERFEEWTKEIGEVSKKLEPYRCPRCCKIVYDDEDYVVGYGKRWHPKCKKIADKQIEKYGGFKISRHAYSP